MKRSSQNASGKVYIVGGGPGDPSLITLKGIQCIKKSDIIVYDALIGPDLLKYCSKKSRKIFVGKRRHKHTFEQDKINSLLIQYARQGKTVCRLKGGDPYVFGRGGEESETLAKEGISFEVVSGVSSIVAVPAMAGIPITHRAYSSFVTIATGHEGGGDWCRYFPKKTLIILMGYARLESILQQLISGGWPQHSAIALICSGTLPNQLTVSGLLSNIAEKVNRIKDLLSSPAMIVAGEVVKLREKIVPCAMEFDLIPIQNLKPHEGIFPNRLKKIKNEIMKDQTLKSPLWVEKNEMIILNGHHRLQALKELGCQKVPCFLLDYSSPYIEVGICPGAKIKSISKKSVLQAANSGKLFAPRSSLHQPKFKLIDIPVKLSLLK